MGGSEDGAIALTGRGRVLGTSGTPGRAGVTLADDGWTVTLEDGPRSGAYRDLATIAVQDQSALLVIGEPAAERLLLDQFGASLGRLVKELRERRLRQRASDAFIILPIDEAIDLVQVEADGWSGIAQVAYDPWGVLLAPLDERQPWIRVRRGRIAGVAADVPAGSVALEREGSPDATEEGVVRLVGLGAAAGLHGQRLDALRAAAQADSARIVGAIIPDATYAQRAEASRLLVDGAPARPADLPTAWPVIEAGVLVDPTFAATYETLRAKAGPLADERAIAVAPTEPGGDDARSWFLVPLPGNLVALELVSEGAHATYLFRAQPRSEYSGGPTDTSAARRAIDAVSEALVDSRFLREPMALPDDLLGQPRYLRYRLALAALPSLAAARARFVARLVHSDEAAWTAALHDLIAWHTTARDGAASWPGRAAQEALVGDASSNDGETT